MPVNITTGVKVPPGLEVRRVNTSTFGRRSIIATKTLKGFSATVRITRSPQSQLLRAVGGQSPRAPPDTITRPLGAWGFSCVACVYIATAASTRVASAQVIHQRRLRASLARRPRRRRARAAGFNPRPLTRRCSTTTRAVRSVEGEHVYEVHPVAGDGRCLSTRRDRDGASGSGGETMAPRRRGRITGTRCERARATTRGGGVVHRGNFEAYCMGMRRPNVGRRPEILMLTPSSGPDREMRSGRVSQVDRSLRRRRVLRREGGRRWISVLFRCGALRGAHQVRRQ